MHPDGSHQCIQFWRTGHCQWEERCRFPHKCYTCGSPDHGTGQHAAATGGGSTAGGGPSPAAYPTSAAYPGGQSPIAPQGAYYAPTAGYAGYQHAYPGYQGYPAYPGYHPAAAYPPAPSYPGGYPGGYSGNYFGNYPAAAYPHASPPPPAAAAATTGYASMQGPAVATSGSLAPGDWPCPGCGWGNYPERADCRKCGTTRPPSAAAAAQHGPDASQHCIQFWRKGQCQYEGRCRFPHHCYTCGSTSHGTGQHNQVAGRGSGQPSPVVGGLTPGTAAQPASQSAAATAAAATVSAAPVDAPAAAAATSAAAGAAAAGEKDELKGLAQKQAWPEPEPVVDVHPSLAYRVNGSAVSLSRSRSRSRSRSPHSTGPTRGKSRSRSPRNGKERSRSRSAEGRGPLTQQDAG